MLLISGEAGVGKSRLMAEAAGFAEANSMAVFRGRAVEGRGAFWALAHALLPLLVDDTLMETEALRPFRSALAPLRPGSPAGDVGSWPAVDPVLLLAEGVLRLLRAAAGERGSLLALDDMHWADRDTLGVLEYLAGTVGDAAVLVMASMRSDEQLPAELQRMRPRPEINDLRLGRLAPMRPRP